MQHFIGYRMFAALDTRATDEQERQRENALRLEFIKLVPTAGRLRACELILQRHHTDQGCKLEYYLAFMPQTSFDFDETGNPPPAGTKEDANFKVDVAGVTAECRNVKTRLVLAHSPGLGHDELAQSTAGMLDTKALRTLFTRRARQVILPTPEGGLTLDLPPVPTHLPTSLKREITARATGLLPGRTVRLRDLVWKPRSDAQACSPVPLPTSMVVSRKGLSSEAALRLLDGMDDDVVMSFAVETEFDWATGAVKNLKVQSIS